MGEKNTKGLIGVPTSSETFCPFFLSKELRMRDATGGDRVHEFRFISSGWSFFVDVLLNVFVS